MKFDAVKIALAAIAVVGMISISGCKKVEEEVRNLPIDNYKTISLGEKGSIWECSTDDYTITWTLQNDSTIYCEVENDSGYKLKFKDNTWYNYYIANEGDVVCDLTIGAPTLVISKEWNSNDSTNYHTCCDIYKLNISDTSLNIGYIGIVLAYIDPYTIYDYSFEKIRRKIK